MYLSPLVDILISSHNNYRGVTSSNYRDNHILCSVLRLMIHKQTYNIILKIVKVLRYNVFNQALVECLPYD